MLSTLKTQTLNADALNTAPQTAPAALGRTLTCQWDLLAILGLLLMSGVYGVYAVTQMTGF